MNRILLMKIKKSCMGSCSQAWCRSGDLLRDDANDVGWVMSGFYGVPAPRAPWPACALHGRGRDDLRRRGYGGICRDLGSGVNVPGPTDTAFQTKLANTLEVARIA